MLQLSLQDSIRELGDRIDGKAEQTISGDSDAPITKHFHDHWWQNPMFATLLWRFVRGLFFLMICAFRIWRWICMRSHKKVSSKSTGTPDPTRNKQVFKFQALPVEHPKNLETFCFQYEISVMENEVLGRGWGGSSSRSPLVLGIRVQLWERGPVHVLYIRRIYKPPDT